MNVSDVPRSVIFKIYDHTIALVRLFEDEQYAEVVHQPDFVVSLADTYGLTDIAARANSLSAALSDAPATMLDAAESGLVTLIEEVAGCSAALETHGLDHARLLGANDLPD